MADESTQKWLGRNRPPRVQITYDLETRGAIEKKELPLVVGIIADLGGQQPKPETVADLKGRKFIEIDRDNFNDVMKSIKPTLNIAAVNKPAQAIVFETLDDFTPDRLVEKVDALKELLTARQNLSDLLVIVDGKETLDVALLAEAKKVKALPPAPVLSPADADAAVGTAKAKADAATAALTTAKTAADAATAAATAKPDDADLKQKSAEAAAALTTAQKTSDDAAAALTAALAAQTEAKKGKATS